MLLAETYSQKRSGQPNSRPQRFVFGPVGWGGLAPPRGANVEKLRSWPRIVAQRRCGNPIRRKSDASHAQITGHPLTVLRASIYNESS
ncbi:hypothetical protein Poly41_35280 [Novipirellula artificiosorum]|uniref:Uncharacterized protein n=1 Tax=Novipirellula artificiosorum TaxID=2528016 RepID=A0A5C6DKU9_9BACT|nr:hypothetical protein Poly41_35280 [Novipirellula artificiosorum]